jgi:uncharacterized protein (TIGR03067 family)
MTYVGMVVAAFAFASGLIAQDTKTSGTAALQGTWMIESINGQSMPEGAPPMTLTFTGDKYEQTVGGDVNERGSIKVDSSKKPMTIDLLIAEGDDAGKIQLGIFEVTGDTIRANLDRPGAGQRPTDFTVKEDSIMFVGKKKAS